MQFSEAKKSNYWQVKKNSTILSWRECKEVWQQQQRIISLCLMWVILKKKNHKFNDGVLSFIELKTLFVRLFEWARTFGTRCMFCCRVYWFYFLLIVIFVYFNSSGSLYVYILCTLCIPLFNKSHITYPKNKKKLQKH